MEATNDGLWDWNIKTDEAYFSPAYFRMLGYEPGGFPGKGNGWKELIHPDDRERALRANLDCIEGCCEHFEVEFRMKAKSGEWRWILGRGKCVACDEQGRALRLVGTHVDITDRKRAEEALRESEARFRTLAEAAFEGIGVSEHGRLLDANEQLLRIMGVCRAELMGQEVASFIAPEDRDRVMASIVGGVESHLEHRMFRGDGTPLIVETHGRTIPYQGRQVRITAIRDITERKQMEEELRKSRDELELRVREKTADVLRLAVAVDKSAEAIVITDSSWVVQYANPAFYQLTGYRSDEVIGRETKFLRSEEEDQSIYEMNRQAAIDGTPKTSRHVIKGKDGTRPVESLISSVRNDSGAITNFVFRWRNISEQLSLEEQLRQAHKMQAIGTLSGGIAHDFNNILAAIIGFTEMVLDDVADNRDVRHKMEQVLKAGFRGRDLVKQILAFSRKTAAERKEISLTPSGEGDARAA